MMTTSLLVSLQIFVAIVVFLNKAEATQFEPRIIGGEIAPEGAYPWFYKADGCGGTLVAPDIVVSAAHCLENFKDQSLYSKTIVHPNYSGDTSSSAIINDFMIVKLKNPILNVIPLPLDDGTISKTYTEDKTLWTLGKLVT